MSWILVVSGDDEFHKRAMAMLKRERVVGAVTDQAARRLVGSLRPQTVVVDSGDPYGHQFLASLRLLPSHARPEVIAIGPEVYGYSSTTSLEDALLRVAVAA